MTRGTAALALAILDIAVGAAAGIVALVVFPPDMADPVSTAMFGAAVVAFSVMGALLVRRVPGNPVGVLLLAVATVQVTGPALATYAYLGGSATPPWPAAGLVGAFGDVGYIAPFVIALIGIPLLFPDGRLPSRRFRWVVWAAVAALVVMILPGIAAMFLGLADASAITEVAGLISTLAIVFGFGGGAAAVWVRFRRGDVVQRQQLKWLLAVAAVALIAFPLALGLGAVDASIAVAFWVIGFLAYLALPVAIGIAVMRYHLYEIDVIINRALVYVPLTAIVAGFYAASITLVGRLLAAAGQSSDMAVVLTTLVVVVIFTPVKNAVQSAVDRRFRVAPSPPEAPQGVILDPTELLHKLGGLRDAGLLTSAEFEAKKREVLARL
jgi:hypothetical protein